MNLYRNELEQRCAKIGSALLRKAYLQTHPQRTSVDHYELMRFSESSQHMEVLSERVIAMLVLLNNETPLSDCGTILKEWRDLQGKNQELQRKLNSLLESPEYTAGKAVLAAVSAIAAAKEKGKTNEL